MVRETLDPWIEGYLAYLKDVRRLAHRSLVDMRCSLKHVSDCLERERPGQPLWRRPLEDYLFWLNGAREAGLSEAALAKMVSHVRGLLNYTWRSGRSDRNVLDGFSLHDRVRKVEPRVLTLEDARRLVKGLGRENSGERRHRLVVLLLYGCGLRTMELCGLDVVDVQVERQELFVKKGKGGYQRSIRVPAAVWVELLAYLTERGGKRGPLFRTESRGKRVSAVTVGRIVKEAAQRAGLAGMVTPKTLRHTFGTHLMDRGVDIGVISTLMGHRSPQETGVYLHVLPGKREAAVEQLGRKEGRP